MQRLLATLILIQILQLAQSHAAAQEVPAWSKQNLFDAKTNSFFIPVELWSGADWDGQKSIRHHDVGLTVAAKNKKLLTGPYPWTHPKTLEEILVYKRKDKNKEQYYTFSPLGVQRVFDQRKSKAERYFAGGIFFPGGSGWKINEMRTAMQQIWKKGTIEQRETGITVNKLSFDQSERLTALTITYSINGQAIHQTIYEPGKGRTAIIELKQRQ